MEKKWKYLAILMVTAAFISSIAFHAMAEDEWEGEDDDRWDLSDDFKGTGNTTGINTTPTDGTQNAGYTKSQVQAHNTNSNCWVIIYNKVYDITSLIGNHPGGNVFNCGGDNTQLYASQHGTSTTRMNSYYKGLLSSTSTGGSQNNTGQNNNNQNTNQTSQNSSNNTGNNSSGNSQNGQNSPGSGITLTEVEKHNKNSDCWVILFDKAYDITSLVRTHSGGNVFDCGGDNTQLYVSQHGTSVSRMSSYLVGRLASSEPTAAIPSRVQAELENQIDDLQNELDDRSDIVDEQQEKIDKLEAKIAVLEAKLGVLTNATLAKANATAVNKAQRNITEELKSAGITPENAKEDLPRTDPKIEPRTQREDNLFRKMMKWFGIIR